MSKRMFNKESCRACGAFLTPVSVCNFCKEYISWLCGKCERMEDVTHSHDYCRVVYKKANQEIRNKQK
ncbi:MAG: hypothetical protein M3250_06350 [Thermoproteota archaeon]|jgi:hypothetical protein|nr:hypothetical protein [Thermoproteota archaeon]